MLLQSEKYKNISYDPNSGTFFYSETMKPLHINEGFVHFKHSGKRVKLQAIRLAWECLYKTDIAATHTLLAKDFDKNNAKASNLLLVPSKVASKLKEAHRNLTKYLKITQHPKDAYALILTWRENGKIKKEVHYDAEGAKRKYKLLQLKFAKLITKYCLFE